MNILTSQLIKDIKCPICQGQIDLVDWKIKYASKKYNFCCVNDWEHYRLFLIHWETKLKLESEIVIIYDNNLKYEIFQSEINPNNQTTIINIYTVDAHNKIIEGPADKAHFTPSCSNIFNYDSKLFDFSLTNRDKIVNRVKTILLFK